MKILTAAQIKNVDRQTIAEEPIKSIDLMERAAMACVKRIVKLAEPEAQLLVFCGKGNNGGDGLAITRLLLDLGYNCRALAVHHSENFSEDAAQNFRRLKEKYPSKLLEIKSGDSLLEIKFETDCVAIDALLGTGINKPVEGWLGEVIEFINSRFKHIISIDVPSGLFTDSCSLNNNYIIRATLVLTFQLPKLAFLLPENRHQAQQFEILDIGLNKKAIASAETNYYYISKDLISSLLTPRNKFSYKGTFGHALLLAGSKGKSGAALIAARAAMRSGAGLLSVASTAETLQALLLHLPEAMGIASEEPGHISGIEKPEKYSAIAFGPGVGTHDDTQQTLKKILQFYSGRLVIDADGLNILAENKTWLSFLPPGSILTPHPGEFERLCGKSDDDSENLKLLQQFSIKHQSIVILKGAHSAIAMPDGNIFFNSSGNAGLAKAGSGDGLTGILLGLLSRGYTPPQAALIGVFLHGYAAEICAGKKSLESILISDVIEQLPKALKKLEAKKN